MDEFGIVRGSTPDLGEVMDTDGAVHVARRRRETEQVTERNTMDREQVLESLQAALDGLKEDVQADVLSVACVRPPMTR